MTSCDKLGCIPSQHIVGLSWISPWSHTHIYMPTLDA
jgi:hypothetical protein